MKGLDKNRGYDIMEVSSDDNVLNNVLKKKGINIIDCIEQMKEQVDRINKGIKLDIRMSAGGIDFIIHKIWEKIEGCEYVGKGVFKIEEEYLYNILREKIYHIENGKEEDNGSPLLETGGEKKRESSNEQLKSLWFEGNMYEEILEYGKYIVFRNITTPKGEGVEGEGEMTTIIQEKGGGGILVLEPGGVEESIDNNKYNGQISEPMIGELGTKKVLIIQEEQYVGLELNTGIKEQVRVIVEDGKIKLEHYMDEGGIYIQKIKGTKI